MNTQLAHNYDTTHTTAQSSMTLEYIPCIIYFNYPKCFLVKYVSP